MGAPITVPNSTLTYNQNYICRALQIKYPLDNIDVKDIIFDPSKTTQLGEDEFKCTFIYKGDTFEIQRGPLFFPEITNAPHNKIKSWHDHSVILKFIDEICRVAQVAKQHVVVEEANEERKIMANAQMPDTLKHSFVKSMTISIDSRKFEIEFQEDWHEIKESTGDTKKVISSQSKEGLVICPKPIVKAGYEAVKAAVQDIFPFALFTHLSVTSGTSRKLQDNSWLLTFYDESNAQYQVAVTPEGIATCREALASKPPKALLDQIKNAGHSSIRVERFDLKEDRFTLEFQNHPLTILRGYTASMKQDGSDFRCEERSLGPAWIDE